MAALLLAALLPLQALAEPLTVVECRRLRERRNLLAGEAMQKEVSLVLATRRRLCPQLEALAEQANAGAGFAGAAPVEAAGSGAAQIRQGDGDTRRVAAAQAGEAGAAAATDLDYTAYLQCRHRAEQQLRRSRVVLYTNARGFNFYTLTGARLAREADAWQQRLNRDCASTGGR